MHRFINSVGGGMQVSKTNTFHRSVEFPMILKVMKVLRKQPEKLCDKTHLTISGPGMPFANSGELVFNDWLWCCFPQVYSLYPVFHISHLVVQKIKCRSFLQSEICIVVSQHRRIFCNNLEYWQEKCDYFQEVKILSKLQPEGCRLQRKWYSNI